MELLLLVTRPPHPRLMSAFMKPNAIAESLVAEVKHSFFFFFFLKIYLFIICKYTVAVFRHSRRGRQILLQMVVSHHVVAGI